jgi:predicted small metal-binding protein
VNKLVEFHLNICDSETYKMTLSINCKDAGDPVCTHTMYGETEEELLKNAKEHGMKEHGYSEETWKNEMSHNLEHFRSLIKNS